jgi:ribosomal protein S7
MLIAQDPLRSNKWYGECQAAILSSPFGLHDATHRAHAKGGKMVYELINRLVSAGNGVYLTDARKYFVYDHKTSDRYATTQKAVYVDILKKEIKSVKPTLCVCLGNRAGSIMYDVATENPELLISCITLPHLSGAARGAIVKRYPLLLERKATTTNIAEQYANEIIGCLTTKF